MAFEVWRHALRGRVTRSMIPRVEVSDEKKLKTLEVENANLNKLLAEQMMDVSTLKEMDLSRFDAAPLIASTATKETNYGTETHR
ncbi:hypothetical protein EE36_00195 [Sulfitobacter sp. EE-36]|nr:hypothetical protein EE36_00195 [Sulfitobacter sp. EE-36]